MPMAENGIGIEIQQAVQGVGGVQGGKQPDDQVAHHHIHHQIGDPEVPVVSAEPVHPS